MKLLFIVAQCPSLGFGPRHLHPVSKKDVCLKSLRKLFFSHLMFQSDLCISKSCRLGLQQSKIRIPTAS